MKKFSENVIFTYVHSNSIQLFYCASYRKSRLNNFTLNCTNSSEMILTAYGQGEEFHSLGVNQHLSRCAVSRPVSPIEQALTTNRNLVSISHKYLGFSSLLMTEMIISFVNCVECRIR